ncbi:MAG: chlorite dismutase family protein [Polyangiaceae bacterium]|nr:chlorite dismutase family protein [Polyangiaceae bacterium]
MVPPKAARPMEPVLPSVDVRERGRPRDGVPQTMNRRLFMQLLVFRAPVGTSAAATAEELAAKVGGAGVPGVVYEDVNDPRSIGLLSMSEDPADFVKKVRPLFAEGTLAALELRPELTMFGRSYSSGFEDDLEFWLLTRPREAALNDTCDWAVWYPLRRTGAFNRLDGREKGEIIHEHALIGRAYGEQDLVHDIRLACHGLDAADNEFILGLVGKELHPLSHVVQTMRGTRQTSEYIAQMGPFFVGHVAHRITAG